MRYQPSFSHHAQAFTLRREAGYDIITTDARLLLRFVPKLENTIDALMKAIDEECIKVVKKNNREPMPLPVYSFTTASIEYSASNLWFNRAKEQEYLEETPLALVWSKTKTKFDRAKDDCLLEISRWYGGPIAVIDPAFLSQFLPKRKRSRAMQPNKRKED